MARRRQIYEGKAKILYEGPEPGTLIQYFKDDATAFNAQKRGTISGKGVLNNRISEHLFTLLGPLGVPMIADEHIACFGWASQEEMNDIADMAVRVNDFLCGLFAAIHIRLVD